MEIIAARQINDIILLLLKDINGWISFKIANKINK